MIVDRIEYRWTAAGFFSNRKVTTIYIFSEILGDISNAREKSKVLDQLL